VETNTWPSRRHLKEFWRVILLFKNETALFLPGLVLCFIKPLERNMADLLKRTPVPLLKILADFWIVSNRY